MKPKKEYLLANDLQDDNYIEQRYKVFLNYVRSTTERFANCLKEEKREEDQYFILCGVEKNRKLIETSFGEDVYQKACGEVPRKEDDSHSNFYDFPVAKRKLSCLYEEGFYSAPIDLDYLRKLLLFLEVPFEISYKCNILMIKALSLNLK